MIVDDDTGMTETLFDILTDMGHHVEVVNDGFQAIESVKAQAFDVVLMDIKMPGINGVETYKEIKSIQPGAAVMMMTAYSVEDLVSEALKEGAYGVMHKPIEIDKVVEFIERAKGGALILLVDDDVSTLETLADVFNEKGHRAVKASTSEDAMKAIGKGNFDIVFIDVKMPVLNGLEVYTALKRTRPDIKAIMMTGYQEEVQDLVEEALKNHAYTCIYKPFDLEKVIRVVEGILAGKSKGEIRQIVAD
ncbi:MAG: response regulator [Gammaproteobacteria bacterium]|nr:response regulator [Gammaproteobacteria bacterium]